MKRLISLILAVLMLAGSLAIAVSAAGTEFKDVPKDRWSYKYVKYATDKGYLKGIGNDLFDPSGTTTRGMVVTVLWRREGSPDAAYRSDFEDVPSNEWYAEPVIWAKDSGVVMGVSDTRFDPNGKITREQLATMLYRYADSKNVYVGDRADLSGFSDSGKISSWAKDPVEWAVAAGLIAGVTATTISPGTYATREQFATILQRFDEKCTITYAEPVLISHYTEKEYPLVEDADIYVSTTGDDSAAGTKDAPIKTFAHAVEMARELKATKTTSVVVAFFAGDYGDPAVRMTHEDSGTKDAPVIYCAYGDGDVVFSGGAIFTEDDFAALGGSEKTNFAAKAADKIKKADMSVKYPDYNIEKDVLFSDSGVMTVARYPNKYEDGSDQLIAAGYNSSENTIRITNSMYQKRIKNYHTVDGLYLYGYLTTGWYKDLLETDGYTIDPETEGYDFLIPHPEKARMGSLRYPEFPSAEYNQTAIVNVSEELDAPGEFFVDTNTKTLYVYDPSGTYTFIVKGCAVDMERTDYITFRGLTFTAYGNADGYKGSMINGDTCHGITIDRCTVTKCSGNNAIQLDGCDEGRDLDITVTDCVFSVFANHALKVVGESLGNRMFNRHSNVLIDNNFFSYTNLTIDDGCGVTVMYCNAAVVSHNEFENNSRGAIDYGGCSNCVIEYNSFRNIMYNSSDGGVLYSWNRHEDWNNVIKYNVFYCCPWYGVYVDDDEPGTTVTRNIFFDQNAVVIHDGRNNKMNENIMVDSGFTVTPGNCEAVEEAKAAGNIESLKEHNYYKQWVALFNNFVKYPEMETGFRENFPEVFDLSVDLNEIDSPSFVLNPVNEIKGNAYFTKQGRDGKIELSEKVEKWVIIEDNKFFGKDENPYFVNPSAGDYRMREGADFPDIQFEKIGRY